MRGMSRDAILHLNPFEGEFREIWGRLGKQGIGLRG